MCLVLWHPLDFVIERLSVLWTWPPFIGALLRLVWTAHSAPTPSASMRKKSISSHPHCSDVTWPLTHSATRKKKQHRRSYSNSVWSLLFLHLLFENLVISQWFKSHWTNISILPSFDLIHFNHTWQALLQSYLEGSFSLFLNVYLRKKMRKITAR